MAYFRPFLPKQKCLRELVNQDRGNDSVLRVFTQELEDWSVDPRTEEKHGDLPGIPYSEGGEGIPRPYRHRDLPYWQTLGFN